MVLTHAVTGNSDFTVLKAGQADAIILKTQNHCVVIDCGEKDYGDEVSTPKKQSYAEGDNDFSFKVCRK